MFTNANEKGEENSLAGKWMEVVIMLSEETWAQKDTYHMFFLI